MNKYTAKFQITGTIHKIGDIQTFSSGFTKREIVVNTNTDRESPVALNLYKEDTAKADGLSVGDEVSVEGAINGRSWEGPNGVKFFTDLIVRSVIVTGKNEQKIDSWQKLLAVAKDKGIGDEEVKRKCEIHKAKVGRKFTAEDWEDVAKIILASDPVVDVESDSDDLPF